MITRWRSIVYTTLIHDGIIHQHVTYVQRCYRVCWTGNRNVPIFQRFNELSVMYRKSLAKSIVFISTLMNANLLHFLSLPKLHCLPCSKQIIISKSAHNVLNLLFTHTHMDKLYVSHHLLPRRRWITVVPVYMQTVIMHWDRHRERERERELVEYGCGGGRGAVVHC